MIMSLWSPMVVPLKLKGNFMNNVFISQQLTNAINERLNLSRSDDLTADIEIVVKQLNKFYWTYSQSGSWVHDSEEDEILLTLASPDVSLWVELKSFEIKRPSLSKFTRFCPKCYSKHLRRCDYENLELIYLHHLSCMISPLLLTGSITISKTSFVFNRFVNEAIVVYSSGKVCHVSEWSHLDGFAKVISFDHDNGYCEKFRTKPPSASSDQNSSISSS